MYLSIIKNKFYAWLDLNSRNFSKSNFGSSGLVITKQCKVSKYSIENLHKLKYKNLPPLESLFDFGA